MHESVLVAIARARRKLNAVIIATRALAWSIPSALGGLALVLVLRIFGSAAGFGLWATVLAAGTGAGIVHGFARRMDGPATALWLDERMRDGEILSAAYACLSRGLSGRFDEEIVERAQPFAERAVRLGLPLRALGRRGALSAAACAASLAFISLVGQARPGGQALALAERAAEAKAEAPPPAAAVFADESRDPAAFASSLFPDDPRLARLAERALREGRTGDFQEILKNADLELRDQMDRAIGEAARKKLAGKKDTIAAGEAGASKSLAQGRMMPDGRPEEMQGSDEGSEGGGYPGAKGRGLSGSGGGDDPSASGSGSEGSGEGGGQDGTAGQGDESDDPLLGGKGWGTGGGRSRNWGEIDPKAGTGQAVIAPAKDAPFFELVLPGKDAAQPLSRIAPASGRSAEAAIARGSLPLEYEEYVRSYFLALTKGASE